jgi:hypothetical protein
MVSVEEGSTVTAKMIDLGLAKPAADALVEAAISTPVPGLCLALFHDSEEWDSTR